jgi:hypothetical protein
VKHSERVKVVATAATTSPPTMSEVDDYLWQVYQRAPVKRDSSGDFTWKDPAAAKRFGLSLPLYVITGMDSDFREQLYHAGHAMDAAGIRWSILSGFRDDYSPADVALALGTIAESAARLLNVTVWVDAVEKVLGSSRSLASPRLCERLPSRVCDPQARHLHRVTGLRLRSRHAPAWTSSTIRSSENPCASMIASVQPSRYPASASSARRWRVVNSGSFE